MAWKLITFKIPSGAHSRRHIEGFLSHFMNRSPRFSAEKKKACSLGSVCQAEHYRPGTPGQQCCERHRHARTPSLLGATFVLRTPLLPVTAPCVSLSEFWKWNLNTSVWHPIVESCCKVFAACRSHPLLAPPPRRRGLPSGKPGPRTSTPKVLC